MFQTIFSFFRRTIKTRFSRKVTIKSKANPEFNLPEDAVSVGANKLDVVGMTEISDVELFVTCRVSENHHTELGDQISGDGLCGARGGDIFVQFYQTRMRRFSSVLANVTLSQEKLGTEEVFVQH